MPSSVKRKSMPSTASNFLYWSVMAFCRHGENLYKIIHAEAVQLHKHGEASLQLGNEVGNLAYMECTACNKQNVVGFYVARTWWKRYNPSTMGRMSLCTPSRETSGPFCEDFPAILSISSMKMTPVRFPHGATLRFPRCPNR